MSQNLRAALWVPTDWIDRGEAVVATARSAPGQPVSTTTGTPAGPGGGLGPDQRALTTSPTQPTNPLPGDVWVDVSNPAAPDVKVFQNGGQWIVMATADSIPAYATAAEILTGTEAAKAIAPDQLRAHTVNKRAGAADANKLLRLNATGYVDSSFLSITTLNFHSSLDLTKAPAGAWKNGDFGIVTTIPAAGATPDAGWGIAADAAAVGDLVVYDGTNYDVVAHTAGATNAVLRAGANPVAADMAMTWTAPAAAKAVIDGSDSSKSQIHNMGLVDCVLDEGTY